MFNETCLSWIFILYFLQRKQKGSFIVFSFDLENVLEETLNKKKKTMFLVSLLGRLQARPQVCRTHKTEQRLTG